MKTLRTTLKTSAIKALEEDGALHRIEFKMLFIGSAFACVLITPDSGHAGEAEADHSERVPVTFDSGLQLMPDSFNQTVLAQNPASMTDTSPQAVSTLPDTHSGQPDRFEKPEAEKNYLIPAEEIVGFNFLLNRFNYHFIDKEVYGTDTTNGRG